MNEDLPFNVEYAKSGRASCKTCKQTIAKDSIRMGVMVQSPFFDGKMALWHHLECFMKKKNNLKCAAEIANFANLRYEDQEKIKNSIGKASSNGASGKVANSDYSVEYAKSNRSSCKVCLEKIEKGTVRISKLDDNPEHQRYGPAPMWHHVDCFVKAKEELGYQDSAENLPGFKSLQEADKTNLKQKIGAPAKKRKAEDSGPSQSKVKKVGKDDKLLKEQSQLLFKMRDNLKKHLTKSELVKLLQHNDQHISTGESRLLDHLADCLVFGALKKCPDCKNDSPRFLNNAYVCNGNLTEWTKCQYVTRCPEREKFDIPEEFREKYDFLNNYKYVKRNRHFPDDITKAGSTNSSPLHNMKIALVGKFTVPQEMVTKKIKELGATVSTSMGSIDLCISTPDTVESMPSKMKKVKASKVHVVSYEFLDAVRKGSPVGAAVKQHALSSWGEEDPIEKFKQTPKSSTKSKSLVKREDSYMKKSISQMKVSVKGAAAVDPDSGLESSCHVYQKKKNIYNAVLAHVDIAKGTNSFYKMQVLETDNGSKYYLFRSWGRVGTTIGGNKLDNHDCAEDAVAQFESLFKDKTANEWKNRSNFVKKPGCMYPLDIDYGQEAEKLQKELKPGKNSKLPKPLQELICLIFDIEAMKKAMIEFEIDLKKMPLGKLSKKQIALAYKVLTEALQVIPSNNSALIHDVTNRFFTLIPHDFGMRVPPLLDNEEMIKNKIEMLDSLMEIEFAFNLLQGEHDKAKDPIDEHYEKLNTDIEVLEKGSNEFKCIDTYLKNTHAKTHDQYNLEIQQVFKISRHGESERYQKFKNLHNKRLLWHGSRLTNYVGILSQGLRIAPPEAPVTGYMFGKGVYFADMVSKSANYCFTNKRNPTGLMMLCEVALGNMYERTHAEFVDKLPQDKHSTFGMGQTGPDPNGKTMLGDVEVPCGKPVQTNVKNSSLLYNEYIVYDVNQVNIKYLLKVDFKWKY